MTHHWLPVILAAMLCAPTASSAQPRSAFLAQSATPLIIAHRGASALRPEHTLAAYEKAIDDGADFIEPDLVMTRDGILIARHENAIGGTTDVATKPEFASRQTERVIDGETSTDWFTEDFTLAEIATLRARERLPAMRGTAFDGQFGVPTFEQIIALAERKSREKKRTIGLIPEIKHSSHHHGRGLDPEQALVDVLQRHAYTGKAPIGIQSFEVGNLQRLRSLLGDRPNVFLVQLIGAPAQWPADRSAAADPALTYAAMTTPDGLAAIARYAQVVAPNTRMIIPLGTDGRLGQATSLVADAHAAGLKVHAWTLRPENTFLPPALRCGDDVNARCERGSIAEIRAYADAGVDAMFTDDPAIARRAFERSLP